MRGAISKIYFCISSSTDEFADADETAGLIGPVSEIGQFSVFRLIVLLCSPSPYDLWIAIHRALKKVERTFEGLCVIVFHAMLVTFLNNVTVARKICLQAFLTTDRVELS
mgnify:CR=1 FL=1